MAYYLSYDEQAHLAGISGNGDFVAFTTDSSSIDPLGDNGNDVFVSRNPSHSGKLIQNSKKKKLGAMGEGNPSMKGRYLNRA